MILLHCPRDGALLVFDAGRWQCLWCSFSIEPVEPPPKSVAWQWPQEARPLHERHTQSRPFDTLDEK